MTPVDAEDEDFSIGIDATAVRGKYVIDDGEYTARCVDISKQVSKKSGKDMYRFDFLGAAGQAEGREYSLYCLLEPEFQWKLVKTLAAFGVKPDTEGKLALKKSNVVGKYVTLALSKQAFGEGKENMQIDAVLPIEESAQLSLPF